MHITKRKGKTKTRKDTKRMDKRKSGETLRNLRGSIPVRTVAAFCGITEGAVRNYENGVRTPSDVIKVRLSRFFGVSVQQLFYE